MRENVEIRQRHCSLLLLLSNTLDSMDGIAPYCDTAVGMIHSRCLKLLLNTMLFALCFSTLLQRFPAVKRWDWQLPEASPQGRSSHEWFSVSWWSRACTDSSKRVGSGALESTEDITSSQCSKRRQRGHLYLSLPKQSCWIFPQS